MIAPYSNYRLGDSVVLYLEGDLCFHYTEVIASGPGIVCVIMPHGEPKIIREKDSDVVVFHDSESASDYVRKRKS